MRGHRGWMTGGRAGISSETAVARSFLDNAERDARLLLFNVMNVRFRFLVVSPRWIYYSCEYLK